MIRADAISNLGGGGLKNPDLANLAQCLNYAGTCLMVLVCGPLINKIGIKNACLINSTIFWMSGTGFYINIKYGVEWWLIVAKIITGFGNALLYVGESTAMLTYPLAAERGKYLSIWAGMRNSGSVIGGAISFGVNANNTTAGSVALATYIVFIAFESTGPIWALLLSPTAKVRRSNGSRVPMSGVLSWKQEFRALAKHATNKRVRACHRSASARADGTDVADGAAELLFILPLVNFQHVPCYPLFCPLPSSVLLHRP
jgi:hypothetical protein